jgi:hypothetical protein
VPALVECRIACCVDEAWGSCEEGKLGRKPFERYDADGFQVGTCGEMGKEGGLRHGDWQQALGRAATSSLVFIAKQSNLAVTPTAKDAADAEVGMVDDAGLKLPPLPSRAELCARSVTVYPHFLAQSRSNGPRERPLRLSAEAFSPPET